MERRGDTEDLWTEVSFNDSPRWQALTCPIPRVLGAGKRSANFAALFRPRTRHNEAKRRSSAPTGKLDGCVEFRRLTPASGNGKAANFVKSRTPD